MRRYDLKKPNGDVRWKLTEDDIRVLFGLREVTETTPCRIAGNREWHTINEHLPLLKYEAVPSLSAKAQIMDEEERTPSFQRDDRGRPARTTALTAGWICFGLGAAVAWIFPPAHLFYSVAIILAIICMSTHQVARGLVLLISSCAGIGISAFLFFVCAVGVAATAVGTGLSEMSDQMKGSRDRLDRQQRAIANTLQSNPAHSAAPSPPSNSVQPRTRPVEEWTAKELIDEITRLEELQRASRKAGQSVPPGTLEKLLRVQAAYDGL